MGFFMILMNSFDKFRAVNKFDKCLLLAESCKFHSTKILPGPSIVTFFFGDVVIRTSIGKSIRKF